ncbi:MAG: DUF1634 domain-containing protein [Microthrixaceae bacterium]|nr:DUF1634 domain-containing protein [Microthrixaceae bacterium]
MAVDPMSMSGDEQHRIHRDQRAVQLLLRIGLAVAVVLMLAGLVMKVASGSRESDGIRLFSIAAAASAADLTMALGVLVLAVTPVFRVLALVVLWTRERDWRFVAVAVAVVVVLALAVLLGHG